MGRRSDHPEHAGDRADRLTGLAVDLHAKLCASANPAGAGRAAVVTPLVGGAGRDIAPAVDTGGRLAYPERAWRRMQGRTMMALGLIFEIRGGRRNDTPGDPSQRASAPGAPRLHRRGGFGTFGSTSGTREPAKALWLGRVPVARSTRPSER